MRWGGVGDAEELGEGCVCDMLKCIVSAGLEVFQAIFCCAYMRNMWGEKREGKFCY